MHLNSFEIKTVGNKHFVNIPFKHKDALKVTIPSAKWDPGEKCWYVGPRSLKKLKAWIESNGFGTDAYFEKEEAKRAAFEAKLSRSRPLGGKTYMIREQLQERFGAFFYDGAWYVDKDIQEEAQAFVVKANSSAITKERIKAARSAQAMLELLAAAQKNFNEERTEYLVEDEIHDYIRYGDDAKVVFGAICAIAEDLFYFSQEAQEGLEFHSFDAKYVNVLRVLSIPQHITILQEDVGGGSCVQVIGNYGDVEEGMIAELIAAGSYHLTDDDDASKGLDEEESRHKHSPSFCFRSLVTGKCYNVIPEPKITSRKTSRRVTIYSATGIPVLHSNRFETIMSYWWNGNDRRNCTKR